MIRKVSMIAALIFLMMAAGAVAESRLILSTGTVNLREGPGLDYKVIATVRADEMLGKLWDEDDVQTDARGVDWYQVEVGADASSGFGWVSSKYSIISYR